MDDILVGGVSLIVLILGLVEFAKKFGLSGNGLTILAMVLGVVGSVAVKLSAGVPVDLAGWVELVIYGLAFGSTACGIYDLGKNFARSGSGG